MLTAAYPNWHPSEESLDLYEEFLLPFPAEAVEAATLRIICSKREFAPPVGVIISEATEAALGHAGVPHLSPEEAWGEVMEKIRHCGYYREPDSWSSPAIGRAVKAITWADLCTNENIEANRAHFMRIFGAYQNRVVRDALDNLSGGREALDYGQQPLLNGFLKNIGKDIN
jgi:hypothetical protein